MSLRSSVRSSLLVLSLVMTGCSTDDGTPSSSSASSSPTTRPSVAPTPGPGQATPSLPPREVTPGRTSFEQCLGEPSDPAACTEDLPAPGEDGALPLTTVPVAVMLSPELERIEDSSRVQDWEAAYCAPTPLRPDDAASMRTRAWQGGPADSPEVDALEYVQQVAAFRSVEAAVAEAARLVTAADACAADDNPAAPQASELPLGTQARLVVFAEGGDYSIRGFFRRGNAVASVQGKGESDHEVRQALNETFARMCVFERPRRC